MATPQEPIVKTATQARQGEKGAPMLAVVAISTVAAGALLAIVWFIFFQT